MNIFPRDYNDNLDWFSIIFGAFCFVGIGFLLVFLFALGKSIQQDKFLYGQVDRDQPCEKYTIEEYSKGKVPYDCATKAEELQVRIK